MQVVEHENNLYLAKMLQPKLLGLFLATVAKQPENPQVEFVHYALEIVNICILNKELRDFILGYEIPSLQRLYPKQPDEKSPETNWVEYLRLLEKNDQIRSIKKMV